LSLARSLVGQGFDEQARGVSLYKDLCLEGDRRRCFESDTPDDRKRACRHDGLLEACSELAALYRNGLAACPEDHVCADLLDLMACRGGLPSACPAQ